MYLSRVWPRCSPGQVELGLTTPPLPGAELGPGDWEAHRCAGPAHVANVRDLLHICRVGGHPVPYHRLYRAPLQPFRPVKGT